MAIAIMIVSTGFLVLSFAAINLCARTEDPQDRPRIMGRALLFAAISVGLAICAFGVTHGFFTIAT